jgi:very-short-patch-repair endonuclease
MMLRPFERVKRARRLRREMSLPEVLLWARLRGPDSRAVKFRRQHPVGPYVLDFFCEAAGLCVEIDGWSHGERVAEDRRRDERLRALRIRTLRIVAADVLRDPDQIAEWVREEALGHTTPLSQAMRERFG